MHVEVSIAQQGHEVCQGADEEDHLGGQELDLEQQENHKGVQRNAEDVHHGAADVLRDLLRLDHPICGIEQPDRALNSQNSS